MRSRAAQSQLLPPRSTTSERRRYMYVGTMVPDCPQWQCDGCATIFEWFEFERGGGARLVINVPAAIGGRDVDLCDGCFSEVDLALYDGHFTAQDAARV